MSLNRYSLRKSLRGWEIEVGMVIRMFKVFLMLNMVLVYLLFVMFILRG